MDDLVLAITIALEATEIALAGFPSGQSPASELDEPLTTVDRKVEDFIVRQLCDRRPNDGVLGEEGTHIFSSNERRWLIDPIDGTHRLRAGDPCWRIHLALEDAVGVAVGVVAWPALGFWWSAARGRGAYEASFRDRAGFRRLEVSTRRTLEPDRIDGISGVPPAHRRTHDHPMVDVLRGDLDGCVALYGEVWDHAPFVVLVEEAGGCWTDPLGARSLASDGAVYSNGFLHQDLLAAIQGL